MNVRDKLFSGALGCGFSVTRDTGTICYHTTCTFMCHNFILLVATFTFEKILYICLRLSYMFHFSPRDWLRTIVSNRTNNYFGVRKI